MRPFIEKFPELGEKETRVITVLQKGAKGSLPPDQYAFVELYCPDKGCDCRRVILSVYAHGAERIEATINMGFDEEADDAGPFLDPLNPQSRYSAELMRFFLEMINQDPEYLARLQRHYVMFKEKVDGKPYRGKPFENGKGRRVAKDPVLPGRKDRAPVPQEPAVSEGDRPAVPKNSKVGRNQPCPCGSGKKYKKCCLLNPRGGNRRKGGAVPADPEEMNVKEPDDRKRLEDLSMLDLEIEAAKQMVKTVQRRLERNGKENPLDPDIGEALEEDPKIASGLLHLLLASYAQKGAVNKQSTRYQAILILMEEALTQMRYSAERGRKWAIDAVESIQRKIAQKAFQLEVDARLQTDLVEILQRSKLQLNPEIKAWQEKVSKHYARFAALKDLSDFDRIFDSLVDGSPDNPVELYEEIMANLNLLPGEKQLAAIMLMVMAKNPAIREIASFMLLHPDPKIRIHVPSLFDDQIAPIMIDPVALRRMIGLRNWLPEEERPELDRIIKTARLGRVACAPMPHVDAVEVHASVFDGSGMQVVWAVGRSKRLYHIANVLVHEGQGIREARGEKNLTKEDIKASKRNIAKGGIIEPVEPAYLEKLVSHFIWLGQQQKSAPPSGLLQMAEITGAYWQPQPLAFDEELALLENTSKPLISNMDYRDKVLEQSRGWPEKAFGSSWFEDDSRVDDIMKKIRFPFGSLQMIAHARDAILEEILSVKRIEWSERLLWMALWAKSCRGQNGLPWQPFCVLARELRDGGPLSRIPLMVAVAERSVYSGLRRMKEYPD
jgi:hypothetical protein